MDNQSSFSWPSDLLRSNETILWKGKPQHGHLLNLWNDLWFFLMGIIMIAVMYLYSFYNPPTTLSAQIMFWIVYVVGAYLALGNPLNRWITRCFSQYALTSERIMVKTGWKTKSHDLDRLPTIHSVIFQDGKGVVWFGESGYIQRTDIHSKRIATTWRPPYLLLDNIPDAARVENLIRIAAAEADRNSRKEEDSEE